MAPERSGTECRDRLSRTARRPRRCSGPGTRLCSVAPPGRAVGQRADAAASPHAAGPCQDAADPVSGRTRRPAVRAPTSGTTNRGRTGPDPGTQVSDLRGEGLARAADRRSYFAVPLERGRLSVNFQAAVEGRTDSSPPSVVVLAARSPKSGSGPCTRTVVVS